MPNLNADLGKSLVRKDYKVEGAVNDTLEVSGTPLQSRRPRPPLVLTSSQVYPGSFELVTTRSLRTVAPMTVICEAKLPQKVVRLSMEKCLQFWGVTRVVK